VSDDTILKLLGLVVGPAIIAAIITWRVNVILDRRRAEREFLAKAFEQAASDVRIAIQAGVEYYSSESASNRKLIEARVLMLEQETRVSVSLIAEFAEQNNRFTRELDDRLAAFLKALTGGSFQDTLGGVSAEQAKMVVFTGALLRKLLTRHRWLQIRRADKHGL